MGRLTRDIPDLRTFGGHDTPTPQVGDPIHVRGDATATGKRMLRASNQGVFTPWAFANVTSYLQLKVVK